MAWKNSFMALGLCAALVPMSDALAADHLDGAAVKKDASTDINDVYSWMSADGMKVYLIMTVSPMADKNAAKFSNAAWYVFHTASRAGFTNMTATSVDVICGFDTAQNISCWVGDNTHFISGNANNTAGISSSDGKIKVYAGPRKDHFFFNLDGFNDVRTTVKGLSPKPTADGMTGAAPGCFAMSASNPGGLTAVQTAAVRNQLQKTGAGTLPPKDFFAQLNTLAIVMEIDKSLLTAGGSILSVWGATHKKM